MRKEKTLLIIGIWIMVLPFLGFTHSWRTILFLISGLAVIYLAYLFYLEYKSHKQNKEVVHENNFIDNISDGE
jgi:cbb3-type cytochrome oxidase subunit 3